MNFNIRPDYSERKGYYNHYLIPQGKDPSKERAFSKQYRGIVDSYAKLGIECSSKTQMNRKQSAINAQNNGVSKDSCDRQGHWATTSRTGAYTNDCIPWEAVRGLAGHSPNNSLHSISRNCLVPPESLQKLVFPQIEAALEKINQFTNTNKETELAGKSWLRLLKWCRIIILQDAVVLLQCEDHSNHPLFDHPIFETELFAAFKENLLTKIETEIAPAVTLLERAMPALGESLSTLTNEMKKIPGEINNLKNDLTGLKDEMQNQFSQQPKLADFQMVLASTFEAVASHMRPPLSDHMRPPLSDEVSSLNVNGLNTIIEPLNLQSNYDSFNLNNSGIQTSAVREDNPSNFKFNQNIVTVAQLWAEYFIGGITASGVNVPSVKSLPQRWYGNESTSEGKHFSRRKFIYKVLLSLSENQRQELIEKLDLYLNRNKKIGLTSLNKKLKGVIDNSYEDIINLFQL